MLSPRTLRLDLKCGKGAISPGEKCTKGQATKAASKKPKQNSWLSKAAIAGGTAVALGGALYATKKYKRAKAAPAEFNARNQGKSPKPEEMEQVTKSMFNNARGVVRGTEIAGAGVALAGVGLAAYGVENKNQAATAVGLGVGMLGAQVAVGGRRARSLIAEQETSVNAQQQQYKRQYYQAQEAAKQRQKAAGSGYTNAKTKPDASIKDPFKDLGISERSSDAEIKRRWLELMRTNHPDVGGDPRKAKQINAAYQEILRRRGRRDSIWAPGFSVDYDQLAI